MGHSSKWPNPWACTPFMCFQLMLELESSCWKRLESSLKPSPVRKIIQKERDKIVNDRETLSLWHNKQPDPRACRQEQWAMIFRFWNIYFCTISFRIMHCRSELISYVRKLSLVHSSSLEISTNILAASYSPCSVCHTAVSKANSVCLGAAAGAGNGLCSICLKGQTSCEGHKWSVCGDLAAQTVKGRWRHCKGTQQSRHGLGGFVVVLVWGILVN